MKVKLNMRGDRSVGVRDAWTAQGARTAQGAQGVRVAQDAQAVQVVKVALAAQAANAAQVANAALGAWAPPDSGAQTVTLAWMDAWIVKLPHLEYFKLE